MHYELPKMREDEEFERFIHVFEPSLRVNEVPEEI